MNILKIIKNYWEILEDKKVFFLQVILLSIISSILEFVSILTIIPLIEKLLNTQQSVISFFKYDFSNLDDDIFLRNVFIIIIIVIVLKTLIVILFNFLKSSFISRLRFDLGKKMMISFLNRDYSTLKKINSSTFVSHIENEVSIFSTNISEAIIIIFNSLILVTALSFLLFFINTQFFLYALIFFVISSLLLIKTLIIKMREYGETRYISQKKRFQFINNFNLAFKEIFLFDKIEYFLNRFSFQLKVFTKAEKYYNFLISLYRPAFELIAILCVFIFIYLFREENTENSKILVDLSILSLMAFRIIPAVQNISQQFTALKYHHKSIETIYDNNIIGNNNKLIFKNIETFTFNREINLKKVSISYDKKIILENLNFKILAGSMIGICGPSGSGKTTLIDALCGLLPISAGDIIIDNKKLSYPYRLNASILSQENYLFGETLKENITFNFGEKEIENVKITQILKLTNLNNVISRFKEGLDSKTYENLKNLSGGEKQRISLARVLYTNSQLIILDEPTNFLDLNNIKKILKNLKELKKTIIIISHDKNVYEHCDHLYEIKNKNIKKIF